MGGDKNIVFFFLRENESGRENRFWTFCSFFTGKNWFSRPLFPAFFTFLKPKTVFSRALFWDFPIFSRIENFIFQSVKSDSYISDRGNFEKIAFFSKIFHGQQMLFTPNFLSIFGIFHGCLFVFYGQTTIRFFSRKHFYFTRKKKKHMIKRVLSNSLFWSVLTS